MCTSACATQIQIERQILEHVKAALRITLRWEVDDVGLDQKVSSVRFTAQSFRRHLERILALEDQDDGYLDVVDQRKPHLIDRAKSLQREHAIFREIVDRVVPSMERVSASDRERFERHCDELSELLDQIDRHDQRETDLLQEALYSDEGGEG